VIKLKKIKLINYCGYKDFELDLTSGEEVSRWAMFYGPNGIGKSNFIRAVELLSSPRTLRGRLDNKLFMRRLTYHPNYQPSLIGFDKSRTNLFMEAIFHTDDGDKRVVLENNWDDKVGLTVDEMPVDIISAATFIDADKPNNMFSFQIYAEDKDKFLDIAKVVYGFDCVLPRESMVSEFDPQAGKRVVFYNDFIITKYGRDTVHYKSFSDGEKKIATLLSTIFKKARDADILLVDNIEMHIYFKRHMALLEKIEELFPDCQVIATTHSPIIVGQMDKRYLVDLEQYVK
jgi:AAA15 family ATPase/GTPase